MADQPIDVRVLSPIPEAEGGINFPSLPSSTTIRELKHKIHDALPSRPAPERMRIIYFGRVVADNMMLSSVFDEETLQPTGRRGNLHMVLSEAPRSSTAPPHATHPLPRPSPSGLAAAAHASQRPQSQPPYADRMPAPGANDPFENHRAALQNLQRIQGLLHPPGQAAPNQAPETPTESWRALFRSQNRAGQANVPQQGTTSQGLSGAAPNTRHGERGDAGEHGNRVRYAVEASFAAIPAQAAGLPPVPIAFPPGVRSGTVVFTIPPGNPWPANAAPGHQPSMGFIRGIQSLPSDQLLRQIEDHIASCQEHVSDINNEVFTGTSSEDIARLAPDRFQQAATRLERVNMHLNILNAMIQALVATPEGSRSREILSLQMDNERMRNMTLRLVQGIYRHITARRSESHQETAPAPPSVNNQMPFGTSAHALQGSAGHFVGAQTPTRQNVYQVIGPDGARSLLFPPQPNPANISPEDWAENLAYQRALRDLVQLLVQNQNPVADTAAIAQHNPVAAAPAQVPQAGDPMRDLQNLWRAEFHPHRPAPPGQPAQPRQAPAQNQPQVQGAAEGPGNAAIPLGAIAAHFWLLLRIFGMLWLFSGSGWRRTLIMAFCGLTVYIFQAGIFGAVFGDRIEGLRRHFEALVGVPPQAGAQAGHDQNVNNDQQDPNATEATRRRRREPSPEEVAQRILRERERQRRTWFRDTIQGAERLVALFVASLWPGLGERMVAAREEADAQARRDAQDREERRQREQQEQIQEQQQSQGDATGTQPTGRVSQAREAENDAIEIVRAERCQRWQQEQQRPQGDVIGAAQVAERGDESTPFDGTGEAEQEHKVDKGKGRAVEADSENAGVATGSSEPSSTAGPATRRQPWANNAED